MAQHDFWLNFQALSEREWLSVDLRLALLEAPREISEEAAGLLERMVETWLVSEKRAILENRTAALNVVTIIGALTGRSNRRHLLEILSAFKGYPDSEVAQRAVVAMTNLPLTQQQLEEEIKNLFVRSLERYQRGAN